MSSRLKLILLVLLVVLVFVGAAAIYTGGFAFIFDAVEIVGTPRGGITTG